jgi:3-deoxy-D-manno-octulosonate 8-phosphate phosphatase (KDO 8-P phosphatase)
MNDARAFDRQRAEDRASRVRHLILDVDGVLTDGRIVYTTSGEQVLSFHVHDGLGIKLLANAGIATSIITARGSSALERRARELGISSLYQGIGDKAAALREISSTLGVHPSAMAAVGDDLVDLSILTKVGFSVAVANAQPAIFPYVDFITNRQGGAGAVREVCEFILRAKGLYDSAVEGYLHQDAPGR